LPTTSPQTVSTRSMCSQPTGGAKIVPRCCRTSFKATLVAAIVTSTVISCLGMMIALEFYRSALLSLATERIQDCITIQHDLVSSLIEHNVTGAAFSKALETVRETVGTQVVDELGAEVDGIWTYMLNQNRLYSGWTGRAKADREMLANLTYLQLRGHLKRTRNNPHTKMIKISWSSGEEAGCSLTEQGDSESHRIWAYDMAGSTQRTRWAVEWDTGMRIEPPESKTVHEMGKHPAYVVQLQAAQHASGLTARAISRRLWSPLFHNWVDGMLGAGTTHASTAWSRLSSLWSTSVFTATPSGTG